jgi:hypothetical protein
MGVGFFIAHMMSTATTIQPAARTNCSGIEPIRQLSVRTNSRKMQVTRAAQKKTTHENHL